MELKNQWLSKQQIAESLRSIDRCSKRLRSKVKQVLIVWNKVREKEARRAPVQWRNASMSIGTMLTFPHASTYYSVRVVSHCARAISQGLTRAQRRVSYCRVCEKAFL